MDSRLEDKLKKAEGRLCGLVLNNPEILNDYKINKKLLSSEGLFYIGVTEKMLVKGIEVVDELSFISEIENFSPLVEKYEDMGGWTTVKELMSIVDINNAEAIYDDFSKWNLVKKYIDKGILDLDQHFDKVVRMKASQVVDYIEYQISDIDIDVNTDIVFEDLNLTDKEIEEITSGINIGVNYGKHSPILNYLTMGLPKGDLTMFASYTNGGKSSLVMNNIIIPTAEKKIKSVIIANEQRCIVYKLLLQTYVLTERLNYWKLPRKKFKSGKWEYEDKEMVGKARKIIKEEYAPYITFVKLYDYDMGKVSKVAKKVSRLGTEILLYDTMKYSGETDSTWLSLLEDSKNIFQVCSKYNMAGVITFQLALHTKGKLRIIDENALSNGKQVAEVFSEMIGFRDLWDDEWNGEDCDIKAYKLKKDANGKFTNEKEYIKLDKDKKYKIFFHFKTRNDEVGKTILYEFAGHQNKWHEIGYCTVNGKNRY